MSQSSALAINSFLLTYYYFLNLYLGIYLSDGIFFIVLSMPVICMTLL